jgi:hypothetical protein
MMVKDFSELYGRVIVEQHKDNLSKAHIYFYSVDVFSRKGSDATKFVDMIDSNEIPAIEVKGLGEHGLAYCSPSPHKDVERYEIAGTLEPQTCGKAVESLLFAIYKKYGLDGAAANIQNGRVPISFYTSACFVPHLMQNLELKLSFEPHSIQNFDSVASVSLFGTVIFGSVIVLDSLGKVV